jgi:hypothetical protein
MRLQTIKEFSMKTPDAAAGILKAGIERDVVTGTLNTLNEGRRDAEKKPGRSVQAAVSNTYTFSQSVLSAVYEGKGTLLDSSR